MKHFVPLLVVMLLFAFSAPAVAGWHTHWVKENYSVTVHPSPVWTSSGWNVPSPYSERRARWVQQRVWVNDPPIIYTTTPIYSAPICTPIYTTPIYFCPIHSPTIIYPGW